MNIDKIIKEITEEVMKSIHTEEAVCEPGVRGSAYDVPVGRSVGRGCGSAYDMGPCVSELRKETGFRTSSIGKGSVYERNYSGVNKADFECGVRHSTRTHGSVYDYQTHL